MRLSCSKQIRDAASNADKRMKCPACQQVFRLPGGTVQAAKPSPTQVNSAPNPRQAATASDGVPAAPAFGGNPYAAASSNPCATPAGGFSGGAASAHAVPGRASSPTQYIVSGIFISVWAGLLIISGLVQIVLILAVGDVPMRSEERIGNLLGLAIATLVGAVMLAGGISLAIRRQLILARVDAILITIPCFGVCVFPIRIWAVVIFSIRKQKSISVRVICG